MSWPSTGSVIPVGDACWNSARLCHWDWAPPERMSATTAAATRPTPPVALRMLDFRIPTARRPGPERTRSAISTLATR